jgi:MAP/microtubule affinity-regulating kinase
MKDKWMNINYENDELKPYEEPSQDFNDNYRIEIIIRDSIYNREQVLDSLTLRKYDDIMAFYLLLGIRTNEVKRYFKILLKSSFLSYRMIRLLKLN